MPITKVNSLGVSLTSPVTFPAGTVSLPSITTSGDLNTGLFFPSADTIAFTEGGAEAMRITSDGRIGINTTSSGYPLQVSYSSNSGPGVGIVDNDAQNGNTFIQFKNNGTTAGAITSNGTTTMTYGSASDYRLKKNLTPMIGALNKILLLKPQLGKWKMDDSNFVGFIAHELAEVFPDAVIGEKDKKDVNGNIIYQMLDAGTNSIIATLTAAIQEQQAIIEELKTRLTALESK
jgi:hypothetical protein